LQCDLDSPPVPQKVASASVAWMTQPTPDARSEAPLTARAPIGKPLETSEVAHAPLTARGPRQVENCVQSDIAKQYDHDFQLQTNAVLQRALQTLESYKDRTKTSEMASRNMPPASTGPLSPRHPRTSAPLASPQRMVTPRAVERMVSTPREAFSPQQVVSRASWNPYAMPESSPLRAAFLRTPNSQSQACMPTMPMGPHSAPNLTRQAQPLSQFQGRSPSPAAVLANPTVGPFMPSPSPVRQQSATRNTNVAQTHRPWGYVQ
jgi:hypothetical protein